MTFARFRRGARALGLSPATAAALLGFYTAGTVFEGLGIGMLLPVFGFIQAGHDAAALAAKSRLWAFLVDAYGALGLPLSLPVLLATVLFFFLVRQAFIYGRLVYTAGARHGLIAKLREEGFRRYMSARLSYHERERAGDVVNDLTVEVERAVACLFETMTLVGAGILMLAYFAILMAVSAPMTLAAAAVLALAVVGLRGIIRRSRQTGALVTEANQHLAAFLIERLKSARLVRLSGTEAAESAAIARLAGRQRERFVRLVALGAQVGAIIEPVVVVAGLAFLYAGSTVFGLALEEIGLFLVVILRLLPIVKEGMQTRQSVLGLEGSLDAVEKRLSEMAAAREPPGGNQPVPAIRRGIRFADVSFVYRGGQAPALDHVHLEIPAGAMTALVGPSGAGKSTLIDLIPRLRDPDEGQVLFDDVPVADIRMSELRRAVAYAPQAPQIFNVSVAEHIRYGRPEARMDDIVEAAKLAGAHAFIEALPQGYDTLLGESGVRLSGGQRQRIDLARVLVRRAQVLILDEPTSQLDADAEAAFRDVLARINARHEMTVIVVAHRLSTVGMADSIVVMNHGQVADQGTHAELIARGGWYARAFAKQRAEPRAGPVPPAIEVSHG